MSIKSTFEKNEGRRKDAYLDSLKIWTIGIGFNLERGGANEALHKQGVNPDMIWAAIEEAKKAGGGRKPGEHTVALISDAQIDALFDADYQDVVADLKKLVKGYDTMPPAAQEVLQDMRFQLGPSRLRGFVNTLKSFEKKDWKAAAKGLRDSKAYTQTKTRWERNAKALEAI